MRSTKAGTRLNVRPIKRSSWYAGTITATLAPCHIDSAPLRSAHTREQARVRALHAVPRLDGKAALHPAGQEATKGVARPEKAVLELAQVSEARASQRL